MGNFHSFYLFRIYSPKCPYIDDKGIIAVVKSVLCSVNTQYVDIAVADQQRAAAPAPCPQLSC